MLRMRYVPSWTYVRRGVQGPTGRCWLKNSVARPVPDPNTVSGVKFRRASVRIDMKSLTEHLWFEVPGRRGFINITPQVEALARAACEGLVWSTPCTSPRASSSMTMNPVFTRLRGWLEKLAPEKPHSDTSTIAGEDNADAHLKRPHGPRSRGRGDGRETRFRPWEQIFYGEFDGRRRKRVLVKIIGE